MDKKWEELTIAFAAWKDATIKYELALKQPNENAHRMADLIEEMNKCKLCFDVAGKQCWHFLP